MSFTPAVALGAAAISPLVHDLGACLIAAALLSVAFERLRVPTIAALLAAGVVIGPVGLQVVHDQRSIETIANLGLTLLLFVIGLEVNVRSLLASGRTLLLSGALQVPLSIGLSLLVFLGLRALGLGVLEGRYAPLYMAVACAFSSTLLVVKFLQQHLALDTVSGRLIVGLLIFQDVWAIVILALQPSFESPSVGPIALTFAGIVLVALAAAAAARWLLPLVFRIVAPMPELLVTAALGWCFGLGLFGAHLGDLLHLVGIDVAISVSLEMGALIAGASIATFPYAYEVVARVGNLRDFFVTLFFVGLGMSIPVPDGGAVLLLALVVSAVAIAVRYVLFLPLLYLAGLDRRNALDVSTKLAQVSEFCLVIAYIGLRLGHLGEAQVSVIIFAFVLTALLTPTLFKASDALYQKLKPLLGALGMKPPVDAAGHERGEDGVRLVLLGFHRLASALLHDLERFHADLLPHTAVIDLNVANHAAIRDKGVQVIYGDIANQETLRHAHIDEAEVIVATIPDELLKGTSNAAIVRSVRALSPRAFILAGASRPSAVKALLDAGANHAFVLPAEAAQSLLAAIYAALNGNLTSFIESHEQQHGRLAERVEILR
jgi:Kef-type K+ transport system membrane component KefB/voltage-gated potassium channel Kch